MRFSQPNSQTGSQKPFEKVWIPTVEAPGSVSEINLVVCPYECENEL